MDIHQTVLLARLLAQAQTAPFSPTGTDGRITGDQLARALTPKLRITGLAMPEHRLLETLATQHLLAQIAHTTGVHIASFVGLLHTVQQTAQPQAINLTTKHEALAVLRTLLQGVSAQKTASDHSHVTLVKDLVPHQSRPAHTRAFAANKSLASAVNISVAALCLDNRISFNRLLQILDYIIKNQNLDTVQRPVQQNFNLGTLTPHSPSMFPFAALINKRRRRRAKSKKRPR